MNCHHNAESRVVDILKKLTISTGRVCIRCSQEMDSSRNTAAAHGAAGEFNCNGLFSSSVSSIHFIGRTSGFGGQSPRLQQVLACMCGGDGMFSQLRRRLVIRPSCVGIHDATSYQNPPFIGQLSLRNGLRKGTGKLPGISFPSATFAIITSPQASLWAAFADG